jgi:anaphase-promoting complex subunit 5
MTDGLHDAIYYLKRAESDYRTMEMYASVQDMLYLQAVVHEALGEKVARDETSERLMEVEKIEKKMQSEMDEGMIAIWDVVCEIGVGVASGDTYHDWEP